MRRKPVRCRTRWLPTARAHFRALAAVGRGPLSPSPVSESALKPRGLRLPTKARVSVDCFNDFGRADAFPLSPRHFPNKQGKPNPTPGNGVPPLTTLDDQLRASSRRLNLVAVRLFVTRLRLSLFSLLHGFLLTSGRCCFCCCFLLAPAQPPPFTFTSSNSVYTERTFVLSSLRTHSLFTLSLSLPFFLCNARCYETRPHELLQTRLAEAADSGTPVETDRGRRWEEEEAKKKHRGNRRRDGGGDREAKARSLGAVVSGAQRAHRLAACFPVPFPKVVSVPFELPPFALAFPSLRSQRYCDVHFFFLFILAYFPSILFFSFLSVPSLFSLLAAMFLVSLLLTCPITAVSVSAPVSEAHCFCSLPRRSLWAGRLLAQSGFRNLEAERKSVPSPARGTKGTTSDSSGASALPVRGHPVSWIRRRDLHVLTVGRFTYTSDQRFQAIHMDNSDSWLLQIQYPQKKDAGMYECQVSTLPKISRFIALNVIVSKASIAGGPTLYLNSGSTLNLTCEVMESPVAPDYVFWYHDARVINYDIQHGVSVQTEKYQSRLLIANAQPHDSGNYSCVPSNAEPASIVVHVLNGERPGPRVHPWAAPDADTESSGSRAPPDSAGLRLWQILSKVAQLLSPPRTI
ncbi:hypothetical protein HPB48_014347 [Haemaphysalis longicornis]|uniref:Ig-like domain-containing protein n=1 Tax=Haemaphysalis longicornis TaxID=44386 RepID=A0A9J6G409_HAELO|nr:hypothetical protein HPB48_014347 [Haemaphysalis longicornis]